ncbi:MAG TPA: S8 family serine peptidase [Bacteriovoracaceae bacterium]|nr:S8 family serine peptidase [Bacteriovoracaceae bacterium]
MKALAVLCLTIVTSLNAATIAVIDSGTDLNHPRIKLNNWNNDAVVFTGPYAGAFNGWNFAENNSQVFDNTLLSTFDPEMKKFNTISSKSFMFTMTDEEKTWAKEKMKTPGFDKEVGRYSTYIHGTHVAGIAVNGTNNKVMAIKLLATPAKAVLMQEHKKKSAANDELKPLEPGMVLNYILTRLAFENAEKMKLISTFIAANGADVANGSFGMGMLQAMGIANQAFQITYKRAPTDQELIAASMSFMNLSIRAGEAFVAAAPKTLFVFAAGNDSLSNDELGSTPANIKADNTITVAATYKDQYFAPFSNYGTKMVEVAAPGMIIMSSIPGNDYMEVSGTSQAAPYVSNIAGRIKDANAGLTPLKIKKILMGTVDKKEFLKARVTSGGIVNAERAVYAAIMSRMVTIEEAIERSHLAVPVKLIKLKSAILSNGPRNVRPTPMPSLYE